MTTVVVVRKNGQIAIDKALEAAAADRGYDAVLMDMNYTRDTTGGFEGLDLISRLRGMDGHLPIVVMTARDELDLGTPPRDVWMDSTRPGILESYASVAVRTGSCP